jgi:hypothetical protein
LIPALRHPARVWGRYRQRTTAPRNIAFRISFPSTLFSPYQGWVVSAYVNDFSFAAELCHQGFRVGDFEQNLGQKIVTPV